MHSAGHSWHDNGAPKFDALQKWADGFHSRPKIWLDKVCADSPLAMCTLLARFVDTWLLHGPGAQACIDQTDIDANLAALPLFLSGCKNLVVLAGLTYSTRLWCVMEVRLLPSSLVIPFHRWLVFAHDPLDSCLGVSSCSRLSAWAIRRNVSFSSSWEERKPHTRCARSTPPKPNASSRATERNCSQSSRAASEILPPSTKLFESCWASGYPTRTALRRRNGSSPAGLAGLASAGSRPHKSSPTN